MQLKTESGKGTVFETLDMIDYFKLQTQSQKMQGVV